MYNKIIKKIIQTMGRDLLLGIFAIYITLIHMKQKIVLQMGLVINRLMLYTLIINLQPFT